MMEFGECVYDFDIIDIAERSPQAVLNHLQKGKKSDAKSATTEEGLRSSKSWCGPLTQLLGKFHVDKLCKSLE